MKVLKFKKQKWVKFLNLFKIQLKPTKYHKFKFIDQNRVSLANKQKLLLKYKNRYKYRFNLVKFIKIFFGVLKFKSKAIKNWLIVNKLESRLDYVLWRSKFCVSILQSRNLISQGFIKVNNIVIKNKTFLLNSGDIISIGNLAFKKFNHYFPWPLVPNFILVNYKTMQIVFLGNVCSVNNFYFFNLRFNEIFFYD